VISTQKWHQWAVEIGFSDLLCHFSGDFNGKVAPMGDTAWFF